MKLRQLFENFVISNDEFEDYLNRTTEQLASEIQSGKNARDAIHDLSLQFSKMHNSAYAAYQRMSDALTSRMYVLDLNTQSSEPAMGDEMGGFDDLGGDIGDEFSGDFGDEMGDEFGGDVEQLNDPMGGGMQMDLPMGDEMPSDDDMTDYNAVMGNKSMGDEDSIGESKIKEAGRMKGGAKDPCWSGHKMVGTKKKGNNTVPNCVPESKVDEAQSMADALKNALSKPEPGSKLHGRIKAHNNSIRYGSKLGDENKNLMSKAPSGHHFDKKGYIRIGEKTKKVDEGNTSHRISRLQMMIDDRLKKAKMVKDPITQRHHRMMADHYQEMLDAVKSKHENLKEFIPALAGIAARVAGPAIARAAGGAAVAGAERAAGGAVSKGVQKMAGNVAGNMASNAAKSITSPSSTGNTNSGSNAGVSSVMNKSSFMSDFKKATSLPTESMYEETYEGNEFYEAYGDLWFNEDAQLDEAEYQGRSVPLGKPMRGDVKKFKVYVKDPDTGNVKKVNFGDPDMKIKKSNPERRKSFRARHNCDNPGPRTKARYWSCRKW